MNWFKLCLLCLMLLPAMVRAEGGSVSAGSRIIPLGMVAPDRLAEADWPSVGYIYERVAVSDYDIWTWNGQFCTFYKAAGETKYEIVKAETVAGLMGKAGTTIDVPWRYRFPNGLVVVAGVFGGSLVLRMFRTVSDSKPKTPKSAVLPATQPPAWRPPPAEPVTIQPAPVLPPPVTDPASLPALQPVGSEPQGLGLASGPATTRKASSQITPAPSLPPPTQILPPQTPAASGPAAGPPAGPAAAPVVTPKPVPAPVAPSSVTPRSPMLALVFRPFDDSASAAGTKPGTPTAGIPGRAAASPPAQPAAKKEPRPTRPEPIFWEIPASALQESDVQMATAVEA